MEPETVIACAHDIELHCRQLSGGGETLHCLMKVARRPATSDYAGLSTQCFQAVTPKCLVFMENCTIFLRFFAGNISS